jgi:hypothetical protein
MSPGSSTADFARSVLRELCSPDVRVDKVWVERGRMTATLTSAAASPAVPRDPSPSLRPRARACR